MSVDREDNSYDSNNGDSFTRPGNLREQIIYSNNKRKGQSSGKKQTRHDSGINSSSNSAAVTPITLVTQAQTALRSLRVMAMTGSGGSGNSGEI